MLTMLFSRHNIFLFLSGGEGAANASSCKCFQGDNLHKMSNPIFQQKQQKNVRIMGNNEENLSQTCHLISPKVC